MAAQNHLSGQLSMFIPARELMKYPAAGTETSNSGYLPMAESPNLRATKLRESKEGHPYGGKKESLYDNIKKEGVQTPVHLRLTNYGSGVRVWDGDHRIATAHDIDPNMEVPVRYSVSQRPGA